MPGNDASASIDAWLRSIAVVGVVVAARRAARSANTPP
jgi:hypothetical protein